MIEGRQDAAGEVFSAKVDEESLFYQTQKKPKFE